MRTDMKLVIQDNPNDNITIRNAAIVLRQNIIRTAT